jgi:signal transduction histidine kinase
MNRATSAIKLKFRLRTILLSINLTVLLLPLVGIFFFRFYENALVRQTETELMMQSAVIASFYKHEIIPQNLDTPFSKTSKLSAEYYTPILPQIDLSKNPILPQRPEGIFDKEADPSALVVGQKLIPILEDAKRTTLSGVRVLDYQGVVIAGKEEVGKNLAHIPEISTALKGAYASVIRQRISDNPVPAIASISRGTNIRIFTAFPIVHNGRVLGVVYMSRTPQNILKYLYSEKEKIALIGLILLVLTATIALVTSYMIVRPIRVLIQRIHDFATGDKDAFVRIKYSNVYELETLTQCFADMATSLDQRSDYIKNFATHVSHEFKTPLTSIHGAAEILGDHMDDMDHAQKQKFITNMIADTTRLKNLVNRLLELAKLDNLSLPNAQADLYPVLIALESRYEEKGLQIMTEPFDHNLSLPIAAEHLETLFINLYDNAHQHGATRIHISITQDSYETFIIVEDNGEGISHGNQDKIFNPFFTTKRKTGGTGLGLGIIQSILNNHGGKIKLIPSISGACFEISIRKGATIDGADNKNWIVPTG